MADVAKSDEIFHRDIYSYGKPSIGIVAFFLVGITGFFMAKLFPGLLVRHWTWGTAGAAVFTYFVLGALFCTGVVLGRFFLRKEAMELIVSQRGISYGKRVFRGKKLSGSPLTKKKTSTICSSR